MAIKLSPTAVDVLREVFRIAYRSGYAKVMVCGRPGQCIFVDIICRSDGSVYLGFRHAGVLKDTRKLRLLREFLYIAFDRTVHSVNLVHWVRSDGEEALRMLKAIAEKFLNSNCYEAGMLATVLVRGLGTLYILNDEHELRSYVFRGVPRSFKLRRKVLGKVLEVKLDGGKSVTIPVSEDVVPLVKSWVEEAGPYVIN